MPIILKRIDRLGNTYYLTRSDKGDISLAGGSGVALSLGYAFGERVLPIQIELEEKVTPDDLLACACRRDPGGRWTVEQSAYDPTKTTVPATHTVEYRDGMGNAYFLRRYESGRVNLLSESGLPRSLSSIIPKDAAGVGNRLAMCNSAAELYAVLRGAVYQPGNLRALPERTPAPPRISAELEQALQVVAGLLNDEDGSAAEAAEELLKKYGMDTQSNPPKPRSAPRPR
jgi:hypothetical protein